MNQKTKLLLKENNERDKLLSQEADALLTDVVVYLRASRLSSYQQELVRQDLLDMVLDGAARGQSAAEVLGPDPKGTCEEIIASLPPRTLHEKLLDAADSAMLYLAVLLGIWLVRHVPSALAGHRPLNALPLSLGDVLAGLLILAAAFGLVQYICKTSFSPPKQIGKLRLFLLCWAAMAVFFSVIYLLVHFLSVPLVTLSLWAALGLIFILVLARLVLQRVA